MRQNACFFADFLTKKCSGYTCIYIGQNEAWFKVLSGVHFPILASAII